jgi:hypothetical protein
MAMNETELLEEASYAWDDGRRSDALQLMKFAVQSDPSLLSVRRALAERYREMGYPDQAGRWGIVFDGWTTEIERDRLARLLRSAGVAKRQTAQFLGLSGDAIPADLESVFLKLAGEYRSDPEVPAPLGGSTLGAWMFFLLATIVSPVYTFVSVLYDAADPQSARTLALLWFGLLALAYTLSAACAICLRAYVWATMWLVGAIALVVLVVDFVESGWIYA